MHDFYFLLSAHINSMVDYFVFLLGSIRVSKTLSEPAMRFNVHSTRLDTYNLAYSTNNSALIDNKRLVAA